MDYYQLVATLSLIIEIVVLVMLLSSYYHKRARKFRQHGITMVAVVVLHTGVVLAWMVPIFVSFFSVEGLTRIADIFVLIALVHSTLGVAADLLGIWLVASWMLRRALKTCFLKKGVMCLTLAFWLISFILSLILYLRIIRLL